MASRQPRGTTGSRPPATRRPLPPRPRSTARARSPPRTAADPPAAPPAAGPATASAAARRSRRPPLLAVPSQHLQIEVLRRPVESAQYTSAAYAALADDCQVSLSVGRKGQCWDNAVAESFFASVKGELTDTRAWPTRTAACRAIVEYIAWYNGTRLHSTLGYRSPADFENDRDGKIRNVA